MTKSVIFWLIMLAWLVFGLWNYWGTWSMGGSIGAFVLFALLGWRVFGSPVKD